MIQILPYFTDQDVTPAAESRSEFLLRQIDLLNRPKNGRLYNHLDLLDAFSWYTRSRSLYQQMRNVLTLPSISTLSRITRKAKNTEDAELFRMFFDSREDRQKACVLIIDEVYVKASLAYAGGVFQGMAENSPNEKATTVLAVMVKCVQGGGRFVARLVPCSKLTAAYQYEVVTMLIDTLERDCGAAVVGIICDNNRLNQSFFKRFFPFNPILPHHVHAANRPGGSMFLIYDPVHLVKNLRNNWITEKEKTLEFPVEEEEAPDIQTNTEDVSNPPKKLAMWSHLQQLSRVDQGAQAKLSSLTHAAVSPSNIQKQNVKLVLQVFCDKTVAALRTCTARSEEWVDTALWVEGVLKLWKVFNCKSKFCHDSDKKAILTAEDTDPARKLLTRWAEVAKQMRSQGQPRRHALTGDTADALQWTCRALLDLSADLMLTSEPWRHQYVLLGHFQQDDLEEHFAHFRRSAGCNYFISVKDVINTHSLDRAKLLLSLTDDIDELNDQHSCSLCDIPLTDAELILLDDMTESNLFQKISLDEKMAMIYLAGYIAFKESAYAADLQGDISELPKDVTEYFKSLNHGKLSCPSLELCEFLLIAFCFFANTKQHMCRVRLMSVLKHFPNMFHLDFNMPESALKRVCNIIMKRFAENETENAITEPLRKVAKLSSASRK